MSRAYGLSGPSLALIYLLFETLTSHEHLGRARATTESRKNVKTTEPTWAWCGRDSQVGRGALSTCPLPSQFQVLPLDGSAPSRGAADQRRGGVGTRREGGALRSPGKTGSSPAPERQGEGGVRRRRAGPGVRVPSTPGRWSTCYCGRASAQPSPAPCLARSSHSVAGGAERALEKLLASPKRQPLPRFTENEAGVRGGHEWVGMCGDEPSARPPRLAVQGRVLLPEPRGRKRKVSGAPLGLGSREGSLESPAFQPCCLPRSPHSAPPGRRRRELGDRSWEGTPRGSAQGARPLRRGVRACGRGGAARRGGWAPSGLCASFRAPPAPRGFRALFPRARGRHRRRGPGRPEHQARAPARPRPSAPPPCAASPPPPGRHYPAARRGRRGGAGWGRAGIRAGCAPVSRWCQFRGLGIFPPFTGFWVFLSPSLQRL